MHGSYRRIIVAAFGWLILANAGPDKGAPNTHPQPTAGSSIQPPSPSPTPTEPYYPYPAVNGAECYKAKNHDTADLCAQWRAAIAAERAAKATEWAAGIAAGGMLLSGISIVLIFIAILQTRKANRIAKREYGKARNEARVSARSAEKALEHAQASSWKQLRPYIGIESVCHQPISDPFDVLAIETSREIIISIRNYGATPGYVVFGTGVDFWHEGNPEPVVGDISHYYGYNLLPSQVVKVHIPVAMFTERRVAIERGKSAILLFTHIKYDSGEDGGEAFRQKFRATGDVFKAGRMDEANNNRPA